MDRLQRDFGIRLVEDDEPGLFTGYASVFGVKDAYDTVFDKGSFKKTIKEHKGRLPLVWMHNIDEPIGLAYVEEDDHGFLVKEGRLNLDVQRGQEVYSGMKFREGYITQMSHTFKGVKTLTVKDDDEDVEHFKEVQSFEISPVTTNFAANEDALITSVRTQEELTELDARPLPNEHACRLVDPNKFKEGSFRRTSRKSDGKTYHIISGRLEGKTTMTEQAYRYPKDTWTSAQARKHCKAHDGIGFEPAKRERIIVPVGIAFQIGRLSALLREPPIGTLAAEPRRKPGDHLRVVQEQITRIERVLKGA